MVRSIWCHQIVVSVFFFCLVLFSILPPLWFCLFVPLLCMCFHWDFFEKIIALFFFSSLWVNSFVIVLLSLSPLWSLCANFVFNATSLQFLFCTCAWNEFETKELAMLCPVFLLVAKFVVGLKMVFEFSISLTVFAAFLKYFFYPFYYFGSSLFHVFLHVYFSFIFFRFFLSFFLFPLHRKTLFVYRLYVQLLVKSHMVFHRTSINPITPSMNFALNHLLSSVFVINFFFFCNWCDFCLLLSNFSSKRDITKDFYNGRSGNFFRSFFVLWTSATSVYSLSLSLSPSYVLTLEITNFISHAFHFV